MSCTDHDPKAASSKVEKRKVPDVPPHAPTSAILQATVHSPRMSLDTDWDLKID